MFGVFLCCFVKNVIHRTLQYVSLRFSLAPRTTSEHARFWAVPVSVAILMLPGVVFAAFENPLLFPVIFKLLEAFVKGVTYVGSVGLVVFIVWAGFLFTLGQGDPEKLNRAKSMFIRIILLGTLLLGLWALVLLVGHTFAGLSAGAFLALLALVVLYFTTRK